MLIAYERACLGMALAMILIWMAIPVMAVEKKDSTGMVAVVNGTVITRQALDREVTFAKRRMEGRGKAVRDTDFATLKENVLEGLINKELLYQESKDKGIKVEAGVVEKKLNEMKGRFPSESQFKRALAGMNISEEALTSQIERELAIQPWIDGQFTQKTKVTDREARVFYDSRPGLFKEPEQVHASHILIKVSPKADAPEKAAAHEKIAAIRERLKKGEDFAGVAKEVSEGPSGPKGGDLGYFRKGQMVPPFEKAAFVLKPGEVSDLVETRFGYHLIKVNDKRPERNIPYAEVEERLKKQLISEKVQKNVRQYVKELKKQAKIERFPVPGP